jgi:dihydrofolate reductase
MRILTHFAVTVDGFAADGDGAPAILAAPEFDHGKSKLGFPEFRANLEAVAMGRTTFDPAPTNAWWPWPGLDVHVLTSRPLPEEEFPSEVVTHSDPAEMVATLRRRYTKDVHLVGGPATIAALLDLGAIDRLEIFIVPVLFGTGTPLAADPRTRRDLELESHRVYDDGTVELSYSPASAG